MACARFAKQEGDAGREAEAAVTGPERAEAKGHWSRTAGRIKPLV